MGMSGCLCWFSVCRVWWEVYVRAVVTTQRENYYKTRGWTKKKGQNFSGQTHKGEGQLFIGPDITLHVIK